MLLIKAAASSILAALQTVIGTVEKRHVVPILANVLLKQIGDKIQFTSSDMESQLRTTVELGGEASEIQTTVNAAKLAGILKSLPGNQLAALDFKDDKLVVKSGKSKFTLQTLPALDFPLMAEDKELFEPAPGQGVFRIPQKTLKKLIDRVAFAMAFQDIRYYLNSILFLVDGKKITLVATNGHRLAVASADLDVECQRQEVIIPRKTVIELGKLLSDEASDIEMQFSKNQAKFTFGTVEFVTKLVEGKYPDFQRVVPRDKGHVAHIDRVILLQALQRIAILTSEKFSGVELTVRTGTLRIEARNADQEVAVDEIDINYKGEHIVLGFNVTYLIDVLANMDQENVQLGFSDSVNKGTVLSIPDDDSFTYVVMSMRV